MIVQWEIQANLIFLSIRDLKSLRKKEERYNGQEVRQLTKPIKESISMINTLIITDFKVNYIGNKQLRLSR